MSAARLRQAAEVLRGAAEGATDGPWFHCYTASNRHWVEGPGEHTGHDDTIATGMPPADATYIVTADPTFGLAVAAWLDSEARFRICSCKSDDCPDQFMNAVADSILGGTE